jgi:hypothetical protein
MVIRDVTLLLSDHSAVESPCLDNNGDTCALLKIKTDNLKGLEFPNTSQYIRTNYLDGTYYVYIPSMCRIIDMVHKDYTPVHLDLAEFGYKRLRDGKVYQIIVEVPNLIELNSSLVMKVEPKESKIIIDDQEYCANEDGLLEIPIDIGKHSYMVSAPNYYSRNSNIYVGKSEAKTISIHLQPIFHEVYVGCNVRNAYIVIDNINYGKVGSVMIQQGRHIIRVLANGYVDAEKDVEINASVSSLHFVLEKNKYTTHVHAIPVTIISNSGSSRMFKNNKIIKYWKNGATIMFLPGKYMLSDDEGNTCKIVVGSEPMTVRF